MAIELKVTWNNDSSSLMFNNQNDDLLTVTQGGSAAAEDKGRRQSGSRVFWLADSGDVTVTFDLKVASTTVAAGVTMLKVVQKFSCSGGAIKISEYDTEGVTGIPGMHPLVMLPAAQQLSGAATVFITTDFVDVTGVWMETIAPLSNHERQVWEASDHHRTNLFVLACLNGFPKLWFASVPAACDSTDHASALVFYRPRGYPYVVEGDDFASVFFHGHDLFRIWRFLLTPVCNHPATPPPPAPGTATGITILDRDQLDHTNHTGPGTWFPPASFERALDDSGRSLVILWPVPDDFHYGSPKVARNATSAALPEMAQTALACLHARGAILNDPGKKARFSGLKRYGLGGFSGGGDSLWPALQAAVSARGGRTKVRELYVFDANGWSAQQNNPHLILSAAKLARGDFRLRVVPRQHTRDFPWADVSMFDGHMQASAHPDLKQFPEFFDLRKKTSNLSEWYWHYVKSEFEATPAHDWFDVAPKGDMTPDMGSRHQFAIFGGEDSSSGWTFMRKFLDVSSF
jgi:hypothetical protein